MNATGPKKLAVFLTAAWAVCALFGQTQASDPILPWTETGASFSQALSTVLGWQPDATHLCQGHFAPAPHIVVDTPHPKGIDEEPTHITAKGYAIIHTKGVSKLQDGIAVTQPGRRVTADTAYIYRNDQTGQIEKIVLVGHVHLQEKGRTVVNDHTVLYLKPQQWTVVRAAYRVQDPKHHHDNLTAWGTAQKAHQSDHVTTFEEASYSTCNPTSPTWELHSQKLIIDQNNDEAKAYNTVLHFGKIPVLYTPYASFSLNNQRRSGLLMPDPSYNNDYGFEWSQPFFWNMAPNYDMTLNTVYYAKGGVQFNDMFRFLSERSTGFIFLSELPHDRVYDSFKTYALNNYPNNATYAPYRSALENSSDNRFFASMNDRTVFNPHLSSDLVINYVTDPYYFSDFGGTANTTTSNQLLNLADLNYKKDHWDITGMVLAYQTLHLINQTDLQTTSQFQRYPEFDAMGRYPQIWHQLEFDTSQQVVNFVYTSDFDPNQPEGQRLHWQPALSYPFTFNSGYLTPMAAMDTTSYWTQDLQPGLSSSANRTLPILNVDTGMYFDTPFHAGKTNYIETFEPRLYYLYVPYENQNNLPNYNTYLIPFSYNQLYTLNQFTGIDRLENANQISLGLTTRLLNGDTSQEKLNLSAGVIYFIDKPHVCLDTGDCDLYSGHFSPITGKVSYHVTPHWTTTGSMAWDPNIHQTNNSQAGIRYSSDGAHILYTGYAFTQAAGTNTVGNTTYSNDSKLYTLAIAWPLTKQWRTIGYLYYDFVHRRAQTYYAGLEYNSCCWAMRLVVERSYTGYELSSNNAPIYQYSNNYLVSIDLKGLMGIDSGKSGHLLASTIPGYVDQIQNSPFGL